MYGGLREREPGLVTVDGMQPMGESIEGSAQKAIQQRGITMASLMKMDNFPIQRKLTGEASKVGYQPRN